MHPDAEGCYRYCKALSAGLDIPIINYERQYGQECFDNFLRLFEDGWERRRR